MPPRAHRPDVGRLREVQKFGAGQSNPTCLLDCSAGRFVLRSKPAGQLLKSAHLVEREFRVMQALAGNAVPVPPVMHLEPDATSPTGRAFFIMAMSMAAFSLILPCRIALVAKLCLIR